MNEYAGVERNTFEDLDARPTATFSTTPAPEISTGPLAAIGWLVFSILACCAPAIVWALWGVLL